jgi:putative transposase
LVIGAWVLDYNPVKPLSSLGYKTPAAYADHLTATGYHAALLEGSARSPVGHTSSKGVSPAEALIAAG